MKDTNRSFAAIKALKQSARTGGQWYSAPERIEAGEFLVTVACDPFGDGDLTAYQVAFEWDGAGHAQFVFDISEYEEDLSPGSSSPIDGWVAWGAADLLAAWVIVDEGELGSVKLEGGSPFGADDDRLYSPEAWAELARTITLQLMR